MAHVVTMPRQGNTVESCVLVGWRVGEGAKVKAGEILCDVETDKAVFEVPAEADGTVLKLLVGEGEDVPVLAPIAVIGAAGEDWAAAVGGAGGLPPAAAVPAAQAAPPPAAAPGVARGGGPAMVDGESTTGVSPRARALAALEAVDAAALAGTGPGGRVLERDVLAALAARPPLSASAKAAVAAGAPVPASGSGPAGRVTLADLRGSGPDAATPGSAGSGPAREAAAAGELPVPDEVSETQVRGIRKVIAERMLESLASTAQFTIHAAAPAARLRALRARLKDSPPALGLGGVTVGDLVLFAVARTLASHRLCNSRKEGDTVRTFSRVHLGLAVDTPRGLMVPVIRNADALPLAAISAEAKRLAAACVEGRIGPDELAGSTFTVSNLGALGVEWFTPVINAPEVCVLGVGAILPKPFEAADGTVSFAPALHLSLTSDHQVVDGAPAARFLRDLSANLADIDLWLAK